jgi:uncharacterized protein
MFARPFIDSIDFARNGRKLRGEIPIVTLSRLSDMLSSSEGNLRYTLIGSQKGDVNQLEIELTGTCQLRCQRCLDDFTYCIEIKTYLQLVSTERLDELEVDEDAIEATPQLDVLALLEDELLLNLPFAPKHPEGMCVTPIKDLREKDNPFAILALLKKQ